ncbi:hypothetical protein [Haemophilus haemolyticus]|uniref:hypothetical protein n=1 Tax=Haemophilus haemolyticus TaxID=726 RepID=UPI000E56C6C8|nr:hypothetical protein [Haemophilus haemolyticus]
MWLIFDISEKERVGLIKRYFLTRKINKGVKLDSFNDIRKQSKDLPNFDKEFDTIIKFWVPQIIHECVTQEMINGFKSNSIAHTIREFLLIHCYGISAVQCFREKYRNGSNELPTIPEIKFSIGVREAKTIEEKARRALLGKNLQPYKISVHHKLKDDLTTLANLNSLSLSEYLRKEMIKHYLGNGFFPNIELSKDEESIVAEFINSENE